MKKTFLKKSILRVLMHFLRNLIIFLLFKRRIFLKTLRMCNFCRRLRFKKNNAEKNIFYCSSSKMIYSGKLSIVSLASIDVN